MSRPLTMAAAQAIATRRQALRNAGRTWQAKERYYSRPAAKRANVWQELGFVGSSIVLAAGLIAAAMMVYAI
jgi:hypothetical protein